MGIKHYASRSAPLTERIRAMSEVDQSGCWEWIASQQGGNCFLKFGGVSRMAHRASYEAFIGQIPDGLSILRTCLSRSCVNPEHLVAGIQATGGHEVLPEAEYQALVEQRLSEKSERSGECLLWQGQLTYAGYGQISIRGTHHNAHRIAYSLWVGPIPDGLEVDHLCNVRNCIEPTHLEAVTHAENIRRRWARETECVNGHDLAETAYRSTGGRRVCRACRRDAQRAYRAQLQARSA